MLAREAPVDADVAENATLSLQGSRIVNFDRNLNRRLTQTVITAVLVPKLRWPALAWRLRGPVPCCGGRELRLRFPKTGDAG